MTASNPSIALNPLNSLNPGACLHANISVPAYSVRRGATDPKVSLLLQRYALPAASRVPEKGAVLLLHGASASSRSFVVPLPSHGAEPGGLVRHLLLSGYDVWTLDWRGSGLVAGNAAYSEMTDAFTMDEVARVDIPEAIRHIRQVIGSDSELSIVGHCIGAATLAIAIAGGHLRQLGVRHVVLSTIGLFYQVSWDGWSKAEDQALERVVAEVPGISFIHPDSERYPWPKSLEDTFQVWPKFLLPEGGPALFRRLSFMFGTPYLPSNVPESIHRDEELSKQFGAMPITLYLHCGQNVRRGFAAPFDDTAWSAVRRRPTHPRLSDAGIDYLSAAPFRDLNVTLLTGDRNRLWHHDSIVLMHEWLLRAGGTGRKVRHILPGYAHQDLLWAESPGRSAARQVYPLIERGLPGGRDHVGV